MAKDKWSKLEGVLSVYLAGGMNTPRDDQCMQLIAENRTLAALVEQAFEEGMRAASGNGPSKGGINYGGEIKSALDKITGGVE